MAAKPLIVIVGQTASGKTALGIALAKQYNGEIIAADSRTVYREMNIGTAKPTLDEREGIPHHLFDVVNPDELFTAVDFQRLANERINDILARGKLPIVVGGTGLYVDALLYNFAFLPNADPALRSRLRSMNVEGLQAELAQKKLPLPRNSRNPRHLMRVIETNGQLASHGPLRPDTLILGMQVDSLVLQRRISERAYGMVRAGFVDEVTTLYKKYGGEIDALRAPGYREIIAYLKGEYDIDEAIRRFVTGHRALAKRQRTWFKRNKSIHWISKQDEAVDLLTSFLNKYRR